jgi:hypothetical protein
VPFETAWRTDVLNWQAWLKVEHPRSDFPLSGASVGSQGLSITKRQEPLEYFARGPKFSGPTRDLNLTTSVFMRRSTTFERKAAWHTRCTLSVFVD